MRLSFVLAFAMLTGCATAVDDLIIGSGAHDSGKGGDSVVADPDSSTTTDSSVTSDSSSPDDTSEGPDTAEIDSSVVVDTGEIDTGEIDTGEVDTGTPPVDTGPTGGPCDWCLGPGSTCSAPDEDYSCLFDCLVYGAFDCVYKTGTSKPCTCI